MTEPHAQPRSRAADWSTAARAGALYVLIVFAIAFAVGAVRVLWVAPRIGAGLAVIVELPIVLAASWRACRACVRRFAVANAAGSRAIMGAVAFVALMLLEFCVAVWMFGESPAAYGAQFATAPGAIGLAGQLGFALIPLAQAALGRRARPP